MLCGFYRLCYERRSSHHESVELLGHGHCFIYPRTDENVAEFCRECAIG